MTLAQELAKLNEPAPRSIDPEAFDAADSLDAASRRRVPEKLGETPEEVPLRQTPGKLLRGIALDDAKYRGRVVRRRDLVETGSDVDDGADDSENLSDHNLEESSESDGGEGDGGLVGKVEGRDMRMMSKETKEVNDEGDEEADDVDEDEQKEFRVMKRSDRSGDPSPERTKAQLKQWGDLVGVRIRLQPLLLKVLELPKEKALPDRRMKQTCEMLQRCLTDLLEIRNHAIGQKTAYISKGDKRKLKRSRTEAGLGLESKLGGMWKRVERENEVMRGFCEEVFDRWHDRSIHALGISGKKLKALNQPISFQVDQVIQSGKEVVQRSQMRESKHDPEIYNDTDFYQQLLKEYISTAGHSNGHTTEEAIKGGKKLKRSKKKGVDVRASKGRKIRYTVHDKLVNFVAPNPRPQSRLNIDQLMSSLFMQ